MSRANAFTDILRSEFPDDRVTFQKGIATFHPENAGEAAAYFKLANKHGQKSFITGFGNNLDPEGELFHPLVAIRTDRLNQLLDVALQDFYVKVGAGFPLREINLDIAPDNLYLPHSALPYVGSVGGAIAVNLAADVNHYDLQIKKYLIRAEIVTPEGEIITPGSACFKSVSGLDVVKIFAPSWGLLGLVVNATFRVLPLTAREEFDNMRMQEVDRAHFLSGIVETNTDVDAEYSRKIKARFDPNGVLPIV
ncbi:MAG: FAD-binding protein [candidate division Zixibacteria bacterium]|nr:FAD-binding protein [candidate division Zixibacteria bacterium]